MSKSACSSARSGPQPAGSTERGWAAQHTQAGARRNAFGGRIVQRLSGRPARRAPHTACSGLSARPTCPVYVLVYAQTTGPARGGPAVAGASEQAGGTCGIEWLQHAWEAAAGCSVSNRPVGGSVTTGARARCLHTSQELCAGYAAPVSRVSHLERALFKHGRWRLLLALGPGALAT